MNEDLKKRLTEEFGLNDEQIAKLATEGVKVDSDLAELTADDIVKFTECGLVVARKIVKAFKPAPDLPAATTVNAAALDVLPQVPGDDSWLASLAGTNVLKFSPATVIGAVSAALAARVDLFSLPERIVLAMEAHAQSLEEPVGEDYYAVHAQLTERRYGDIFGGVPGVTGNFATERRKAALIGKIETALWPTLMAFHEILDGWMDSWQKTAASPTAIFAAIASMTSGAGAVPGGGLQPPSTDAVRSAADEVIRNINRIFAGTGIPVVLALAHDAQQIRKTLDNRALPGQIGVVNRDQMLKKLGVGVSSDYARIEATVKRYVLSIIELPNVSAGQSEIAFIAALHQLGNQIQWESLVGGSARRSGGGTPFPGDVGRRRVV